MKRIFPTSMVTVYVFGDDGEVCAGTLYEGFIHHNIHKPCPGSLEARCPCRFSLSCTRSPNRKKTRRICLNKRPHWFISDWTVVKSTTMASSVLSRPGSARRRGGMMQPVRPRLGNGVWQQRTIKSSRYEHTKSKLLAFLCGIDLGKNYLFAFRCILSGSRVGNIRVFIKWHPRLQIVHADAFGEFFPPLLLRLLIWFFSLLVADIFQR